MHGYQSILKHAPCALWVILRTEMSSWYTIDSLSALMGMRDCELCKSKSKASFAGFLFLPTFTRCCFSCVCYDERLTLVTLANATRQAVGMTYDKLRRVVPVLKMFPGKYYMEQVSSRQKVRLSTCDEEVYCASPRFRSSALFSLHGNNGAALCEREEQSRRAWSQLQRVPSCVGTSISAYAS